MKAIIAEIRTPKQRATAPFGFILVHDSSKGEADAYSVHRTYYDEDTGQRMKGMGQGHYDMDQEEAFDLWLEKVEAAVDYGPHTFDPMSDQPAVEL
jgi:hypothetical protein